MNTISLTLFIYSLFTIKETASELYQLIKVDSSNIYNRDMELDKKRFPD